MGRGGLAKSERAREGKNAESKGTREQEQGIQRRGKYEAVVGKGRLLFGKQGRTERGSGEEKRAEIWEERRGRREEGNKNEACHFLFFSNLLPDALRRVEKKK